MSNLLQTIDEKIKVCDNGNYSQHDYEQTLSALKLAVAAMIKALEFETPNPDAVVREALASIAKTLGVE